MRAAADDDQPGAKDECGTVPSTGAIAAALSGMAAAWLAAGSTGLLAHALRHGLAWLALVVAVVVAWPGRANRKDFWFLVGSLAVAAVLMAPAPAVYNVLGVSLVLAMLARAARGCDRRALLVTAQAACVLAVYVLARTSIATVWTIADAVGGTLGALASRVSGEALSVGASFAGLDFLMLMAVVHISWLVSTRPPRLARGVWAAAAILGGHLAYLVLLAHAINLHDALPAAPPPPEFRDYVPPPWSWSDAVRGMLPWNVPLVAGAIQLVVAGAMFRWAGWLPAADERLEPSERAETNERRAGTAAGKQDDKRQGKANRDDRKPNATKQPPGTPGPDASSSRLRGALAWSPAILAALVPLLITYAPGESTLAGKKIVAYERGYLDWEKPAHDSYGQASAGMYGMLPEFVASLGGRLERSLELSEADLANADVLLLIHPVHAWTDDQLERIWDFVRRGGSLLVVAETMVREDGLASSFNEVLKPTGIEVRFDVAAPSTWNWQETSATMAHPAVAALGDARNRYGVARGPSIRLAWPARPVLLGRWGWSDPGHDAVWTDVYRYDAGERLGDLVLAAERRMGAGTVVVLSGNSALTNEGNVNSYVFTGRLLAYLAGQASSPQAAWRQAAGILACLVLVGLIVCPAMAGRLAGALVVLAVVLTGSRTYSHLDTQVLPDGRQRAPRNNVAYIDGAHLEAYADGGWGYDGVAGLALTLMRNGYQPFFLPELSGKRLERAGMLISIAPARRFSAAERAIVRRFVERGGIFIAMAGAEQAGPIQPLLDEFDLRVPRSPVRPTEDDLEPVPMGHFTTLYRPAGADYDAGLLLYAGWPIECDRSQEVVKGFENLPLVARAKVGEGSVVLIGDTDFAMNKNLEYVGGEPFYGRHDNAHFWRWLISWLTEEEDWLPPAKARSGAEPTAAPEDRDDSGATPGPAVENEAGLGDPFEGMLGGEAAP